MQTRICIFTQRKSLRWLSGSLPSITGGGSSADSRDFRTHGRGDGGFHSLISTDTLRLFEDMICFSLL
jgi:hypothetical protein